MFSAKTAVVFSASESIFMLNYLITRFLEARGIFLDICIYSKVAI